MITAHELAKALLDGPDLPVAISSMGHSYEADCDDKTHGILEARRLEHGSRFDKRHYIVIGHGLDYEIERDRWRIPK